MEEAAARMAGRVDQEVFKSLSWYSGEKVGEEARWYYMHVLGWKKRNEVPMPPYHWTRVTLGRELYMSIRLVTLLKSLGIKRATASQSTWV